MAMFLDGYSRNTCIKAIGRQQLDSAREDKMADRISKSTLGVLLFSNYFWRFAKKAMRTAFLVT
jgi:hypothetical protein